MRIQLPVFRGFIDVACCFVVRFSSRHGRGRTRRCRSRSPFGVERSLTGREQSEFHPTERLDTDAQRDQCAQDAHDQAGHDRDRQPEPEAAVGH